jgi:hypothetical protein
MALYRAEKPGAVFSKWLRLYNGSLEDCRGRLETFLAALRSRMENALDEYPLDYWVTDGQRDYGLEVSGTIEEDIEGRHREKVRQLLANPYRADGYAVAVRFAVPEILFSFHRFGEQSR